MSYAISILAQFNSSPTFLAIMALLRLATLLFNTCHERLALGGGAKAPVITSFCDSEWSGCINTRYSRNGPITWYSKRQTNVALSSAEAERAFKTLTIVDVL